MNRERLLRLADFLDTLPPSKFNYGTWADTLTPEGTCGTTACALGWAAQMPEFRELGLCLVNSGWGCPTVCLEEDVSLVGGRAYRFVQTERAGMEIFDLKLGEFEYLFLPDQSDGPGEDGDPEPEYSGLKPTVGPDVVAAHIRDFCK